MCSKKIHRSIILFLSLSILLLSACEPTPAYLERWANREGSEDMFAEHLTNPEVSHEVRVKALELLLEQWGYSSSMLRDGSLLRDIADVNERDSVMRDVIPHLQELYDMGGSTRNEMRDAAYQLRQGTDNDEISALYEAVLQDWILNQWTNLCEIPSTITIRNIFEAIGEENGAPIIAQNIAEKSWNNLICQAQQIRDITWLSGNDMIATAYTSRWDAGEHPEGEQTTLSFIEEWQYVGRAPAMRSWLFNTLATNQEITPFVSSLFQYVLLESASENPIEDVSNYVTILQTGVTDLRCSAFDQIVKINGSEGLETAISSMSTDANYGHWQDIQREGEDELTDGERPNDGFALAANLICNLPRLTELDQNTRTVFESHIADENIIARTLSIRCLANFGNTETIALLEAQQTTLGDTPIQIPYWETTLQSLIPEIVTAIRTRIATPTEE